MKTNAMVTREIGRFDLEEVSLREPGPEEVLVRIRAVGLCHTDISVCDGCIPGPMPMVLGHEGAGVIEQVGSAVRDLEPGDHVVLTYSTCGRCAACLRGKPYACEQMEVINFGGCMPDGTKRIEKDGEEISTFFNQSSFSGYSVSHQSGVVKVPKDIPFEILAPLGCGISTGAGTIMNKLAPEPGSSVAVFGCGAVGMSAVMAAGVMGCTTIIAVDIDDGRLAMAKELGATHIINSKHEDPKSAISAITGKGAGHTIETSGIPEVLLQAIDCTNKLGTTAVIGAPRVGTTVEIDHFGLITEKSISGVTMGSSVPKVFIPALIRLYKAGLFPIDKLIKKYRFTEIDRAVADAKSGVAIKPVMLMSE